MLQRRWIVDVYYSGFVNTQVMAESEEEALCKGRADVQERLRMGVVIDRDGALSHLISSLEPWLSCDTAEELD